MYKLNIFPTLKWVTALHSGDYIQSGEPVMHNEDGYCCLGVAEELSNPILFNNCSNLILDDQLPLTETCKYYGITSCVQYASMNDGNNNNIIPKEYPTRPMSFIEIANRIEQSLYRRIGCPKATSIKIGNIKPIGLPKW